MKTLIDRIHAMFLGIKIGDRWGLPVECQTRAQIIARTNGRGITQLEDVRAWRKDITANYGATSDDWQLTAAVGWCFVRNPSASPENMAHALIQAMHDSVEGWGGTTLSSIRAREQWFMTNGQKGLSPYQAPLRPTGIGAGAGCGVAMRIGAIAAVCVLQNHDEASVIRACIEHGKLTHPDPRAWIGAAALTLQLVWLLRGEMPKTSEAWLFRLVHALQEIEQRCIDEYGGLPISEPRICQVLQLIIEKRLVDDRDGLLAEVGNECPTHQSVPFAIATFLRCLNDFRTGILETISEGGDADSIASMVGASLGAHLGFEAIPPDWIRSEDNDAKMLACELVAAISGHD